MSDLSKAVRSLRLRLGLTQTVFAAELGRSLRTIQRWETLVYPRASALLDLSGLAERHGKSDLANEFMEAFRESFPLAYPVSNCDAEEATLP